MSEFPRSAFQILAEYPIPATVLTRYPNGNHRLLTLDKEYRPDLSPKEARATGETGLLRVPEHVAVMSAWVSENGGPPPAHDIDSLVSLLDWFLRVVQQASEDCGEAEVHAVSGALAWDVGLYLQMEAAALSQGALRTKVVPSPRSDVYYGAPALYGWAGDAWPAPYWSVPVRLLLAAIFVGCAANGPDRVKRELSFIREGLVAACALA